MKRLLEITLAILFCAVSLEAAAQTIKNASYQVVGHIRSDGTIQDQSYRTIGHIKSDGTVQDASYRIIGHLNDNGDVQDASYRIVGHIKDARLQLAAGAITPQELKAVEDEAIRDLVSKQVELGFKVVTDGEFRRQAWHLDFMWGFDGVGHAPTKTGLLFHGEQAIPKASVK